MCSRWQGKRNNKMLINKAYNLISFGNRFMAPFTVSILHAKVDWLISGIVRWLAYKTTDWNTIGEHNIWYIASFTMKSTLFLCKSNTAGWRKCKFMRFTQGRKQAMRWIINKSCVVFVVIMHQKLQKGQKTAKEKFRTSFCLKLWLHSRRFLNL
jgi:hypothetical protein